MAFLTVEKGDPSDLGKDFSLGESSSIIGRSTPVDNPDIALHDESKYISRHHAEISCRENHFHLRDLHSTNGTTLDDTRISPEKYYPLKHDSLIGLGITLSGASVVLRFKETRTESTRRVDPVTVPELASLRWLRIDKEKGEIWVDGNRLVLPRKEFDLVTCLYNRAGKVCSRDVLIAEVWPEVIDPGGVADAAIDQLVHRIRAKIELDISHPTRIVSRKGFGYMLV